MINSNDKGYEGGAGAGAADRTNKNRQNDSLKEYLDKEPMTQVKPNVGEPTTLKGDLDDHQSTSKGRSKIRTEQASKEYQKKKHTKIENDS